MKKKYNRCLENRSFSFSVDAKENDNESILYGKPIIYSSRTNLNYFDEVIEPGALDNTNLKDVRFLVNHDTSKIPLARSRNNNGNSTMKLTPTSTGLEIEVKLDTENNSEARSLFSAVKRGDISGMSFMFSIDENGDDWEGLETEHPLRHVRSIKDLVEVSAVTFPAYESTSINARASNETLDNVRSVLENARSKVNLLDSKNEKDLLDSNKDLDLAKNKFNFYYKY